MLRPVKKDAAKNVRQPSVAGMFYPADPAMLRYQIAGFLGQANGVAPIPKALIVPHAGYTYSGAVAASGYALLKTVRARVDRVVLIGPSHHVPFYGLAVTDADQFATPLGMVPVDRLGVELALELPQVHVREEAHRHEHSLEVHLPFLQLTLADFALVPLAVGQASANEVADVLDVLWGGDETLIVVSSDLSHYHDYWTARAIDSETSNLIEQQDWQRIDGERACGHAAIRGLLKIACKQGLRVKTVDLRNSGDTSGTRDQVVGYGTYVVYA